MRRIAAVFLTLVVLAGVAWTGSRRPSAPSASDPGPSDSPPADPRSLGGAEARIQGLLQAASDGDVAAYLDAFDGPLRSRLEREADGRGRVAFAADLRASARARKSHAVYAAEPVGNDRARVVVESVYGDRNERQTYRLDRVDDGWRVAEVESPRGHQPRAKYGASADYQEPEGVPVQARKLAVETGDDDPTSSP